MGSAGDLGPHQRRFRVEHVGIDPLQGVPAKIVVAIAGGGHKAGGGYPVFLHGPQHLGLIVFRYPVDGGEAVLKALQRLFTIGVHSGRNPHFLIQFQ